LEHNENEEMVDSDGDGLDDDIKNMPIFTSEVGRLKHDDDEDMDN
jgi:hypothetical protein